jgi:hypothetical protein
MGERQIEAMLDIIHDLRRQGSVTALTDLLRGA